MTTLGSYFKGRVNMRFPVRFKFSRAAHLYYSTAELYYKKGHIPMRFLTSSLVSSYGFTTNGIKKDFLFTVIYTAHLYSTIILHSSTIKKEDIPIRFLVSSFVSFYGFATNGIKERFFFIVADLFRNCLGCQSYFVFLFESIFYWLRNRLWRGKITNLKKKIMDD